MYHIKQSTIYNECYISPNGITRKDIELICELLSQRDLSQRDIAIASGINRKVANAPCLISNIYTGKKYKDIAYDYKFSKDTRYRKKSSIHT